MSAVNSKDQSQVYPAPGQKRKNLLSRLFLRLLKLPFWLVRRRIHGEQGAVAKAEYDSELHLYSQIFPRGYLHYGYFSDPSVEPEAISFRDLENAQHHYAELLISHIEDRDGPVLDVGCGMGGLAGLLSEHDYQVYPLTPDRYQAEFIREKHPKLTVIHSPFESFEQGDDMPDRFGTIITSESLQYLNLEQSLPRIKQLLKPGGLWIASDYFRLAADEKSSGHVWNEFCAHLKSHGLSIRYQEDVTSHILPTLKFASLLTDRLLLPTYRFARGKLRSKRPGIHYLLEEIFDSVDSKLDRELGSIDPIQFALKKKYMLLVISAD